MIPMAFSRRSSRRLRTANGRAGLVTRQVSSRKTLPGCRGMPYRNEGTSCWVPHSPSPPPGCSCSCNLHHSCHDVKAARQADQSEHRPIMFCSHTETRALLAGSHRDPPQPRGAHALATYTAAAMMSEPARLSSRSDCRHIPCLINHISDC